MVSAKPPGHTYYEWHTRFCVRFQVRHNHDTGLYEPRIKTGGTFKMVGNQGCATVDDALNVLLQQQTAWVQQQNALGASWEPPTLKELQDGYEAAVARKLAKKTQGTTEPGARGAGAAQVGPQAGAGAAAAAAAGGVVGNRSPLKRPTPDPAGEAQQQEQPQPPAKKLCTSQLTQRFKHIAELVSSLDVRQSQVPVVQHILQLCSSSQQAAAQRNL